MSDSGSRLRLSERIALNTGPVPVRLVLALTFMWAGLGKILATFEPAEGDLPRFVEMGVLGAEEADRSAPTDAPAPGDDGESDGGEAEEESGGSPPGTADGGLAGGSEIAGGAVVTRVRNAQPGGEALRADSVELRRVYGIALALSKGATPDDVEGGSPPPIAPSFVGSGRTPVYLAWAAAVTEIVCAALVFIGLFTRLAAVGLIGVLRCG